MHHAHAYVAQGSLHGKPDKLTTKKSAFMFMIVHLAFCKRSAHIPAYKDI